MQLNISTNTTQKIHLTSEVFSMINEEQEKFDKKLEEQKNLKMMIDFELTSDLELKKNQMEIPVIKYKTKKVLKKEEIDLKKKDKKNTNSLF